MIADSPRGRLPERLSLHRSSPRDFSRPRTPAGSSDSSRRTRASRSRRCSRSWRASFPSSAADPAVDNVVAFTGGAQRNTGFMFVQLKPLAERKDSADKIIATLADQARQRARREPVPQSGAGHPRRRQAGQRDLSVHLAGGRSGRAAHLGAEDSRGYEPACRSWSTSTPISRTRACRLRWSSTATPPRASASTPT